MKHDNLMVEIKAALDEAIRSWESQDSPEVLAYAMKHLMNLRPRLAAISLGRKGGKSTSEAKKSAVRANGKLGGRPKKDKAKPL